MIRRSLRLFSTSSKTVSVISVPCNLGQPFLGPDQGPKLLIESGLFGLLADCDYRIKQIPDILPIVTHESNADVKLMAARNARNSLQVGLTSEVVHQKVFEEAKTDHFLLILGGDHCISIGTISGIKAARKSTGIVWVDAHGDINTPRTSGSGNMHGMPLGFLTGLVDDHQSYPGFAWFNPCVHPRDVVYIGLRDLDAGEKANIKKSGIKAYTMYDVDEKGIGTIMKETAEYLKSYDHIHLSYDIDSLDPFFAPHTGTAVRGGLTFREGNFICEYLHASGRLTSMELVEVNPSLHQDIDPKHTIDVALTLIGSTMGKTIL